MKVAIVITNSEEEVKLLKMAITGVFDNKNFWEEAKQDFNKEWFWVVKNKSVSGSSGWHSLESTIKTNPGANIYYFNDFKF